MKPDVVAVASWGACVAVVAVFYYSLGKFAYVALHPNAFTHQAVVIAHTFIATYSIGTVSLIFLLLYCSEPTFERIRRLIGTEH